MNKCEASLLRKIIFLSMAVLTVVSSVSTVKPAFAKVAPANFEEIDQYISTKMKELGIPGAALVIVQGDQIVHLQVFGVADGSGRHVTPQTPFFTGSTGKSFTALAIMQLVEAGQIELDEPVQTYLPWFRVKPADPNDPLLQLDNFVLTPHIAGWTKESVDAIAGVIAANIVRVSDGNTPLTLVNSELLRQ